MRKELETWFIENGFVQEIQLDRAHFFEETVFVREDIAVIFSVDMRDNMLSCDMVGATKRNTPERKRISIFSQLHHSGISIPTEGKGVTEPENLKKVVAVLGNWIRNNLKQGMKPPGIFPGD